MGIVSTSQVNQKENQNDELSINEIKFLLAFILQSNFKGEHLKALYQIVTKLENMIGNG